MCPTSTWYEMSYCPIPETHLLLSLFVLRVCVCGCLGVTQCGPAALFVCPVARVIARLISDYISFHFTFDGHSGNWLKRSSLSGLTDGVEDLLDISSVDRLSFIRQSSKVSCLWTHSEQLVVASGEASHQWVSSGLLSAQVKFTSAVKLSEGGAVGPEYSRDEEENFFKRLGKWRSGRRNPSKLHHTEEKDGRPPPPQGAPHHPAMPTTSAPPPFPVSLLLSVCLWWSSLPASALDVHLLFHLVRPSEVLVPHQNLGSRCSCKKPKNQFSCFSTGNFFRNHILKLADINKVSFQVIVECNVDCKDLDWKLCCTN